jgi:hypothetical protein
MHETLPDWRSLPVWTMKNYKHFGYLNQPFVQVRVFHVSTKGFWIHVTAYENAKKYKTMPNHQDNQIILTFNPNPIEKKTATASVNIDGEHAGLLDDLAVSQGEDLQGHFWNVRCLFSVNKIKRHFNKELVQGDCVLFNVSKQWQTSEKYYHQGFLFPRDNCFGELMQL